MTLKQLIRSAGDGAEIALILGTSEATACRRKNDPYKLTVGELIALIKAGNIEKEDLYEVLIAETRRNYGRK